MAKSELVGAMDGLQQRLTPWLRQFSFSRRGRAFNRTTSDGLTQVVGFQMGSFDPPGTTYIPGLRENLYGRFAINLGIYVPEVARHHGGGEPRKIIHDDNCCIRCRLGRNAKGKDHWWTISSSDALVDEIRQLLEDEAFALFRRFERRDQILAEFSRLADNNELMAVPRIICALILFERGEHDEAQRLLALQARDQTCNPGHPAYVKDLARRLGIDISS
jgi:uncharacterized protein DUF4304